MRENPMIQRILITTGNGMFGRALIDQLLGHDDVLIRAMVRNPDKFTVTGPNLEVVTGDMDDPASLMEPTKDITHVFLTTPMDEHIAAREKAVIDACRANGSPHVINIYGAVQHEGDPLDQQHLAAIGHLKESGLPWTLVSPNSVMETSLESLKQQLPMGMFLGMSGQGKVGLVALADVARVMATVVMTDDHAGMNYVCTGPEAVDMAQVAAAFSHELGRKIEYIDLPEGEFADMLMQHGGFTDRDNLETNVLCHLRAWKEGRADVVTDTIEQVTGQPAMSVADWVGNHLEEFSTMPQPSE
jgi:uncharacterized protein YbjT (DUF2867 family)